MSAIDIARDEHGELDPTMVGTNETLLFDWANIGRLYDQVAVVVINLHATALVTAYVDTSELPPYLDDRLKLDIPPLQQRSIVMDSLHTFYRATAKSSVAETPVVFTVLGKLTGDHA